MANALKVSAILLQKEPLIYTAIIPGKWLLQHSTPSWRIKNTEEGFQRVVRAERANEIAIAVLDQGRSFPNSIVLATDQREFQIDHCEAVLPNKIRFLVVDGQHRLWAQKFAEQEANYSCVIHMGLTVVQMARLFLEINDNQKRVPASLRWDLVRLVRPNDDPNAVEASDLVYELTTNSFSPLYQRIDLTGEQSEIDLKQASIAPELKILVSTRKAGLKDLDFDQHFESLIRFFAAIKAVDSLGWKTNTSVLIKARILRALIRVLPEVVLDIGKPPQTISVDTYVRYLSKIDRPSLSDDKIRALQGSAGIKQIYLQIKSQMGV